MNTPRKRKSRKGFYLWLVFFIGLGLLAYHLYTKKPVMSEELLTPIIVIPENKFLSDLTPAELEVIVKGIKDPNLIPKGLDIPEFSAEQQRPSRYYLDMAVPMADEMLKEKYWVPGSLFSKKNTAYLNAAYSKSGESKYLNYALKKIEEAKTLENNEWLSVGEILKSQRQALLNANSESYIKTIGRMKKIIFDQINTKNPIIAVELLLLANSLPLEDFKLEVLNRLKPVFVAARQNKNEDRKDGLFLTPDESIRFSSYLIDLAWDYRLQNKLMPEWLFDLAEKEACRFAYRLEQDGCLPTWGKDEVRVNRNEEIYRAALIFNRDDLRYISYNGFRAPNAYPPEQTEFEFKELGLFIYRTGWNHAATENDSGIFFNEQMQITYDKNINMISLSLGSITQFVFQAFQEFNSVEEIKSYFVLHHKSEGRICECKGVICDYTVEIKDIDLVLFRVSPCYLIGANDVIKSFHLYWPFNNYERLKDTFLVNITRDEKNKIKEIHFNVRRK